jgi:hypothetical protein
MIEQGLYTLVTQSSTVKAAVGTDANGTTSAFWILAPQGAKLPFLIFSRVSTSDVYTMAGGAGVRNSLIQIVCYATTYYNSRAIADAVRRFLTGYKGTLSDGTVVDSIFCDKDFDRQFEEGGKGFIYSAVLQFRVWYLGE